MNVELKEEVAGGKGHFRDFSHIPGGDDVAARGGIIFESVDEFGNLVDGGTVFFRPRAPLLPVNRAEVAIFVRPFIPDADFVFLEVGNVGVSFEKPEKFVNNRTQMEFFGGETGESLAEVIAGLAAENAEGSGPRAVSSFFAIF